jgi:hypothetical protein
VDNKTDSLAVLIDWLSPLCSSVTLAMHEQPTTVIIQRYLDALPGDTAAEPIVRELLERAVGRLRLLCATFLYRSYPRLTRPRAPGARIALRLRVLHTLPSAPRNRLGTGLFGGLRSGGWFALRLRVSHTPTEEPAHA